MKPYFLNMFNEKELIDILEYIQNENTILLSVNLINLELKNHSIKFNDWNKFNIFESNDFLIELDNEANLLTFDIKRKEYPASRLYLNNKYKGDFDVFHISSDNTIKQILEILKKFLLK